MVSTLSTISAHGRALKLVGGFGHVVSPGLSTISAHGRALKPQTSAPGMR